MQLPRNKAVVTKSIVLGKIASVFGYAIAGIFLLFAIAMISEDIFGTIFFAVMMAPGILLIILGTRIKGRVKRFKHYVNLISFLGITSIEELAAKTGKPFLFVRKDLQIMINKKFFSYAEINVFTNEINIGRGTVPPQQAGSAVEHLCNSCGAKAIAPVGTQVICEYCGSLVG